MPLRPQPRDGDCSSPWGLGNFHPRRHGGWELSLYIGELQGSTVSVHAVDYLRTGSAKKNVDEDKDSEPPACCYPAQRQAPRP